MGMIGGAALIVASAAILVATPFVIGGFLPGIPAIAGAVAVGGATFGVFALATHDGRDRVDASSLAASLAAAIFGASVGYAAGDHLKSR